MSDAGGGEAVNERAAAPLRGSMSLDGDPSALADYYARWAATYDADVGGDDYGLPISVMRTLDAAIELMPALAEPGIDILDAGCGTGRVGVVLAERGYRHIDGVDLSPEMVDIARSRGVYRTLEGGVDLTQAPDERWLASADLVTVGGVFTVGHLPPEALHEVAKLVKPGGALLVTVRPEYLASTNFAQVSADFVASGAAEVLVRFDDLPYTADTHGVFIVYRLAEG